MYRLEIKRRMGEEDIAAISALAHAAALADGHRPLGEHQWLDLVQGGRKGFAGFVAWEPGHPHPVGYAQLSSGPHSWAVEYVVDPHHRSPDSRIGQDLVAAALAEVARRGGGHVHMWVPKPGPDADEIARANGMSRGRELFQMRRPLPLERHLVEEAGPLATRPFRPGRDEQAWLEVNNLAFASHPEQGSWDMQTLALREKEPWFDPEGFLLYEVDGRLAGSCWTKVHADQDPALGEIYVISVHPDFQGQGLGRKLCVAGLEHLARAGLKVGMLYVDSTNQAALSLYRQLGFEVDHVDRAYVIDVPAQPTPETPKEAPIP